MKSYRVFARVTKGNGHQPSFLSVLAVTGPHSAWEMINAPKVTLPPGEAAIVLGVGSSLSGTNAMFLPLPHTGCHVPRHPMNGGIVLLFRKTLVRFFVSSFRWQTLCRSACFTVFLCWRDFSLPTCEKSRLPPWSPLLWLLLAVPPWLTPLDMRSWKGLIDDGLLVTAHCPNHARHLSFQSPFLFVGLFVLTKRLVLCVLLERKWHLEWDGPPFTPELVHWSALWSWMSPMASLNPIWTGANDRGIIKCTIQTWIVLSFKVSTFNNCMRIQAHTGSALGLSDIWSTLLC